MKTNFCFACVLTLVLAAQPGSSQNIGIGTANPAFKLDIAGGRMRIQHTTGQTAGIWLDGPSTPQRAFIGMFDEFHVGLYGNTSNWSMVMNVNTGNVGIGTTLPTADLDINGTLRLRQNGVANGAALHAINGQGVAEWINPTAFRVNGYSFGANILFPNDTWQDINFGNNVAYNFQTASYNTSNSEFVAPRNGVYHFKSQLLFSNAGYEAQQRLRLRRNGEVSTLALVQFEDSNEIAFHYYSSLLDTEVLLQAGDAVWIEASGKAFGGGTVSINGNGIYTWWCGRLVQPL